MCTGGKNSNNSRSLCGDLLMRSWGKVEKSKTDINYVLCDGQKIQIASTMNTFFVKLEID